MSTEIPATVAAGAIPDEDAAPPPKRKIGRSAVDVIDKGPVKYVVYLLVFLWTVPTFGVFLSSFRTETDVRTSGWWTWFTDPSFTLDNYRGVLESSPGEPGLWTYFINSVAITIPSVIISIGVGMLAAYAFSWMKFPGRDWLYLLMVALLMVPLQMALVPFLRIVVDLNIAGTIPAVWLAHTAFGLPFVVFLLRNFVQALPPSIMESARIDGAGHATIFIRLVLPLSVPAIASVGIFQFIWIWNDYLVALVFAGRENAPITKQLADVAGTRGSAYHLLTASAVLAIFVPLSVFLFLQKYFVRGLLAGAVKG